MKRLWLMAALVAVSSGEDFKLTILHTNDVHARIDEFDAAGSRCTPEASLKGSCYGGIARQKYMVDSIKAENPNTLFLNAGDYYQGTMWFYLMKGAIIADTIKFLKHDAMTLGNHEFDEGSTGLYPLLYRAKEIGTPVLGCNVDFSKNPILRSFQPLPSLIVERSGVKIGLIGFLTPDTNFLSNVGQSTEYNGTILTDEIECIEKEAKKLHDQGVKIIIAMGHSGYLKDQEIAAKVPLVRMVVGGHSHTYLSSVDQKQLEKAKGPYPTVVTRDDGTDALVVQDFWLGKYLGYINVSFDEATGDVRSWQGDSPLLLDFTVPKDEEVENFLRSKRSRVDEESLLLIGRAMYPLSGEKDICRYGECALGNLLADALYEFFLVNSHTPELAAVKPIDIAVVNGGGIRGNVPGGNITFGDIVTVYPFANAVWVLPMSGKRVKQMYENALRKYDPTRMISNGGFLHSSGVRLVADGSKPPYERVVSVRILNSSNGEWEDLDPKREYRVAMSSYISQGGDNHDFKFVPNERIDKLTTTDTDIAVQYVKNRSPLHPVVDERLRILTKEEESKNGAASLHGSLTLIILVGSALYRATSLL
ncbi:protein 5NUC [Galendromus occidentalis]|uniref:5'-nucleotidase n=1 Tax=Galendromus occidentalis TaxID=34638 RepID=A0AAJ7PAQ4_9ACAR|nr:protein 5NUC [Galendromus occidentalis]